MQHLWKVTGTSHISMNFKLEIPISIKHRVWPIKGNKYKINNKEDSQIIYTYFRV
jgi:hypothetical protein